MNEELKQKARKHADAYATPDLNDSIRTDIYEANREGYITGATEATKELESQIEKMKCCGNCAKNGHICVAEEMQGKLCGKNKDKWELRR